MKMCRPCALAVQSTSDALHEISDRLLADEYDIHSLPVDLSQSFHILAELARMMHLPELDRDIEILSRAVLNQVEPLNIDLTEITREAHR